MLRSFRVLSLTIAFVLTVCAAGFASGQPAKVAASQATEVATASAIDPNVVVKLDFGKAVTTPLNKDDIHYRLYSFKGKANQLVSVTVQKLSGNMTVKVEVRSQSDVQVAYGGGAFFEGITLTAKLPQDGNYALNITEDEPGAGDFEAGMVSVVVNEATPAAAATATK